MARFTTFAALVLWVWLASSSWRAAFAGRSEEEEDNDLQAEDGTEYVAAGTNGEAIVEEPHVQHVELVEVKAELETKDAQNVDGPCDENHEKYKFDCPADVTCQFWDACPLGTDGSCQDGCKAFAEALELNHFERIYKHVGEMKPSNCKKPCRFTDGHMLNESAVFVATSAAVLKQKVAKLEERCAWTGMFAAITLLSPSCKVRLRKVSALLGFILKALNKASVDVRVGDNMTACQAVISKSVGQNIFDSTSKFANLFNLSGHGHAATVLNKWGQSLEDGSFCEKQVASKSTSCINRNTEIASQICSSPEVSKAAGIEKIIESQGGDETIGTKKIDKINKAMEAVDKILDEPSNPGSSDSLIQMGLMGVSFGDIIGWLIWNGIFGTIFGLAYTAGCLLTAPIFGSKPNFEGNWWGSCTAAHWCYVWGVPGGCGAGANEARCWDQCAKAVGFVYTRGFGEGTPMHIW